MAVCESGITDFHRYHALCSLGTTCSAASSGWLKFLLRHGHVFDVMTAFLPA